MPIDENLFLTNKISKDLYHNFGKDLPIIDYHNHLSPRDIANDRQFNNLSEAWLEGDHYKWRLMRANGVSEKFCSGDASGRDKFIQFANTLPYAQGNPVYLWSHLELKRYFEIDELLTPESAERIWERCNERITSKEYSARNLLKMMKVTTLCTTDDPSDTLEYHSKIKSDNFEIDVLPTFRPDRAMNISDSTSFRSYAKKLGEVSRGETSTYDRFLLALSKRVSYFAEKGCKISDHAFASVPDVDFGLAEIGEIYLKAIGGSDVTKQESEKFRMAVMKELASLYATFGWTMQIHLGALRNNNTRLFKQYGPDCGADSIGDDFQAVGLSKFLDMLDRENRLTPTILYNLNPNHNEILASMAGNFSGCMPGKIQYGAAWWFLDNKRGIENQLSTVANFGLLGRFIGMLTDSRSFLSFTRHEYFRRILANFLGKLAESGEADRDIKSLSEIYQNICYYNAKRYFNF